MSDSVEAPHVAVVDDEEDLCELLSLRLAHHGYRVTTRHSGRDALRLLEVEPLDAMVLDLRLGQESGLDVLKEVQRRALDVPIVMLTAHGTIDVAIEATRFGAHGFLQKPFDDRELLDKIAGAVEHAKRGRSSLAQRRGTSLPLEDRLVGTSAAVAGVRATIARVARSSATVLLLGESGTGKEVAARTLHAQSGRAGRFVAVNCGALPPDLLESELFGYRRGAFTGALRDREGLFAAADGGTLFLDEIGDAPLSVQVKLLRVLQERSYMPLGSVEPQRVDVRLIAATNRDLRADMEAGRFREDLFYRLHVLPIRMPPLRERREDIPLLARLFLARVVAQHDLALSDLGAAALSVLTAYEFPGNVRELANVIEGAALLCNDRELCARHVTAVLSSRSLPSASEPQPGGPLVEALPEPVLKPIAELGALLGLEGSVPPFREARGAFDRAYLTHVLWRAAGNVSVAARMAGRNRTDFYDLLQRYELQPTRFRS